MAPLRSNGLTLDWRDLCVALLARLPVPAAVVDEQGEIAIANQKLAGVFGTQAASLSGCPLLAPLEPTAYASVEHPRSSSSRTLAAHGAAVMGLVTIERWGDDRLLEITVGLRTDANEEQ